MLAIQFASNKRSGKELILLYIYIGVQHTVGDGGGEGWGEMETRYIHTGNLLLSTASTFSVTCLVLQYTMVGPSKLYTFLYDIHSQEMLGKYPIADYICLQEYVHMLVVKYMMSRFLIYLCSLGVFKTLACS